MPVVEFYFDFVSPASYLAYRRLQEVAERTGATIAYRPFNLGHVLKESGNAAPITVPAKARWIMRDFARFAERYRLPFVIPERFPFDSRQLLRAAYCALDDGTFCTYADAVFAAVFARGVDMSSDDVVDAVVRHAGLDVAALRARADEPAVRDRVRDATRDALERGAFGAPTFFVGDDMFFGQDRLDFVEDALAARAIH